MRSNVFSIIVFQGGIGNMNYCADCYCAFDGDVCPVCGTDRVRKVNDGDFCFLTERDSIESDICDGALRANGIQCVTMPGLSGIEMSFAVPAFRRRLYVPFGQLMQAINVLKEAERLESEKTKSRLTENADKLKINDRLLKKIKHVFALKSDEEVRSYCLGVINKATRIEEDGMISGCPYGGHYIFCHAPEAVLTLNSVTFEILSVKAEKK